MTMNLMNDHIAHLKEATEDLRLRYEAITQDPSEKEREVLFRPDKDEILRFFDEQKNQGTDPPLNFSRSSRNPLYRSFVLQEKLPRSLSLQSVGGTQTVEGTFGSSNNRTVRKSSHSSEGSQSMSNLGVSLVQREYRLHEGDRNNLLGAIESLLGQSLNSTSSAVSHQTERDMINFLHLVLYELSHLDIQLKPKQREVLKLLRRSSIDHPSDSNQSVRSINSSALTS